MVKMRVAHCSSIVAPSSYVLQYLRARCVPSRNELRSIKHSLRHEAIYYGVPGLVSYINGEVSPHDMRPER